MQRAILTHTRALHPSSHVRTACTFLLVSLQKTHPPAKALRHSYYHLGKEFLSAVAS
jgi:hypothetical protein